VSTATSLSLPNPIKWEAVLPRTEPARELSTQGTQTLTAVVIFTAMGAHPATLPVLQNPGDDENRSAKLFP
jgi:hypothetical protein